MEEICGYRSPFQTLLFLTRFFFWHYFLNSNWLHEDELPPPPPPLKLIRK